MSAISDPKHLLHTWYTKHGIPGPPDYTIASVAAPIENKSAISYFQATIHLQYLDVNYVSVGVDRSIKLARTKAAADMISALERSNLFDFPVKRKVIFDKIYKLLKCYTYNRICCKIITCISVKTAFF